MSFNFLYIFFLFLDENDIPMVPLNTAYSKSNNLHRSHQHIFQHQSSVSSTASVQTVFQQNIVTNGSSYSSSATSSTGPMVLLGNSSSSASFQSANANGNGNGSQNSNGGIRCTSSNQMNQSGSISSLESNGKRQISQSSNDDAMTVADVADLLHPQYAIITGGRSREGCPIIYFPDNNNLHLLTEYDYQKLITYLCSVPP